MPEANDFNALLLRPHAMDDPIRTADDLPQILLMEFWYDTPQLRKRGQPLGTDDQFLTHAGGGVRILLGDEADNALQISTRRRRDDYFPAHSAIFDLTSSIGMPSPRSNSARPCSTA